MGLFFIKPYIWMSSVFLILLLSTGCSFHFEMDDLETVSKENTSENQAPVSPTPVPPPAPAPAPPPTPSLITGISLVTPVSSPSQVTTPTLLVTPVDAGDTVYISNSSSCTSGTELGSAVASSAGSLNITIASPLLDGSYTLFAYRKNSQGISSVCSTANVPYLVDSTPPSFTGRVNSLIHTVHQTTSPLFEVGPATDGSGSGFSYYEMAIGTTSNGTDILPWTNMGSSPIFSARGLAPLSSTLNYVSIRAVDKAGNKTSPSYFSFWYRKSLAGPNKSVNAVNYNPSNKLLYLAGDFSYVGQPTGAFGQGFIPNAGTSFTAGSSMNPSAAVVGKIYAIQPTGWGGFFIGGEFTQIGGISGFQNLAYVNADGVPANWKPQVNGPVRSLFHVSFGSNLTLFVGGSFTSIMGTARNNLAAINLESVTNVYEFANASLLSWDPSPNGEVLAISANGSNNLMAFGGKFTSFMGQSRSYFSYINTSYALMNQSISPNNFVRSITYGGVNVFFLGGDFTSVNGSSRGYGAGYQFSSNNLIAWNPQANGPIHTIYCYSSCLLGGEFSQLAGTNRPGLALVDESSGTLNSGFAPSLPSGSKVYAIASGPNWAIGGDFHDANNRRVNLALIDTTTGAYMGTTGIGTSGPVYALADKPNASGSEIYAGGDFISMGGEERGGLAAIDINTYNLSSSFAPKVVLGTGGGSFLDLARSGSRIFVTGYFNSIAGTSRVGSNYLAELNGTTGVPTSFEPRTTTGWPYRLKIIGSNLYAMGTLMDYDGDNNYTAVVKLDISTATPTFQSSFDPNLSMAAHVYSVMEDPNDSAYVYLGGLFTSTNGHSTSSLARVNATTGAVDTNFVSPITGVGLVYDMSVDYMAAIANSQMFLVGSFNSGMGNQNLAIANTTTGTEVSFPFTMGAGTLLNLLDWDTDIVLNGSFSLLAGNNIGNMGNLNRGNFSTYVDYQFNNTVQRIDASFGSGLIFVGGNFTQKGTKPVSSLVLVHHTYGAFVAEFPWQ